MAKEKHISLIYHNKIEKPVILDYSTVKTILSNFISNAIKYSNDGVITIKTIKENYMFVLSLQDEEMDIHKKKMNYFIN